MDDYSYVEKIVSIIYDYAKKEKKIDAFYIDKIAEIIICAEELQDFVLNQNFIDTSAMDNDTSGEYIPEDGAIFFRLKELNSTYKRIELEHYSKESEKYIRYVVGNEIILHEFGHAIVLKSCFDENNTMQTQILQKALFDEMILRKSQNPFLRLFARSCRHHTESVYNRYDKYAPEERLSDIYAYSLSKKVAEVLNTKDLYDYETYCLYKTYVKAYKKQENPTFYYLQQLGFSKSVNRMEKEVSLLPFEERLKLGLTLSEEEYNQVSDEYKRIKKKVCK